MIGDAIDLMQKRIRFVDKRYLLELEQIHFVDAMIDTRRIRSDDYVFCIGEDIGGRCNFVVLSSGNAIGRRRSFNMKIS